MKISFITLIFLILLFSTLRFQGLELAIKFNSPLILELSLKVGHKVSSNSHLLESVVAREKFAPLSESSKRLIEILVKEGVDIDAPAKVSKNSGLISSSKKLDISTMELLLSLGAKPNYSNGVGDTALLIACSKGGTKARSAVNLLAKYNADFYVKNSDGDDCLSLARKHFEGSKNTSPDREILDIIESHL